jgi:hypothetical protein
MVDILLKATFNDGISIGKRGLLGGILPMVESIPGFDFAHWAVMINGTIF